MDCIAIGQPVSGFSKTTIFEDIQVQKESSRIIRENFDRFENSESNLLRNVISIYIEGKTICQAQEVENIDANYELNNNLRLLDSFLELEYNWDQYGALPFSKEHIASAKSLIMNLVKQPDISPTGRNSIFLEYTKCNGDYLAFEYTKKNKLFMYEKMKNREIEKRINTALISSVVEKFYEEKQ